MRFDKHEIKALKYSLADFDGDIYLFGSRLDNNKGGGDIDILLFPKDKANPLKLSLEIQTRFFSMCEQKLDVVVFDENPFCSEVVKYAKKIDIKGL